MVVMTDARWNLLGIKLRPRVKPVSPNVDSLLPSPSPRSEKEFDERFSVDSATKSLTTLSFGSAESSTGKKVLTTPVKQLSKTAHASSSTSTPTTELANDQSTPAFTQRTYQVEFSAMLHKLGLTESYDSRKQILESNDSTLNLEDKLLLYHKCFEIEASTSRRPESDKTAWLSTLSAMATLPQDQRSGYRFAGTAFNELKKVGTFGASRKVDCVLTNNATSSSNHNEDPRNVVCTFEFTKIDIPLPSATKRLHEKLFNQVSVLQAFQQLRPFRNFELGVSISKSKCFLLLLDRTSLQWTYIDKCWTSIEGFKSMIAVVRSIEMASIHSLGYPIWFKYNEEMTPTYFNSTLIPPPPFPTTFPPSTTYATVKVDLDPLLIHTPGLESFQRGTCVIGQDSKKGPQKTFMVITSRWVDSCAPYRTTVNHETIEASCTYLEEDNKTVFDIEPEELNNSTTTLTYSAVFEPFVHQLSDLEVAQHNQQFDSLLNKTTPGASNRLVQRHLEITVIATVSKPRHLSRNTPYSHLLIAAQSAISTVQGFYDKGILHRDISPSNVMLLVNLDKDGVEQVKGIVCDFDIAISLAQIDSSERSKRTGTYSTMALEVLEPAQMFSHLPRHDIESIDLVLLLLLLEIIHSAADVLTDFPGSRWDSEGWSRFIEKMGYKQISQQDAYAARSNLYDRFTFRRGVQQLLTLPHPLVEGLYTFLSDLNKVRSNRMGRPNLSPVEGVQDLSYSQELQQEEKIIETFNSKESFHSLCSEYLAILKKELERIKKRPDPFFELIQKKD